MLRTSGMVGDAYQRHVNRAMALLARLGPTGEHAEAHAEGSRIVDDAGTAYLDCGGQGVLLLGHRHPAVVDAVREQLERQPMASRFLLNPTVADAAERLVEVAPDGLEYACFNCSGTDSVEMAIRLARLSGRPHVVAMTDGFHGKTMGSLTLTGRAVHREPFAPLLPDVTHVPFGDLARLREALSQRPGESCVVVEPIQAEAGVVIPPRGYLRGVEEACREFDCLLVVDEIQTGLGRLGQWWGVCTEGVRPDILLAGKVLSGGVVPASALVATAAAFEPFNSDPYLASSTFSNSPLVAAAAHATIDVLASTDVIDRAATLGAQLLAALRGIASGSDAVAEVRGSGLLLGVEFATPALAGAFLLALLERRVLPSWSLNQQRTIRFTPSALMSDDERDWLVEAVGEALLTAGREA
jgi:putrescine aminotransferase